MQTKTNPPQKKYVPGICLSSTVLTSSDIVSYEQMLCEDLSACFSFAAYSLYFPRSFDKGIWQDLGKKQAVYLKEEKKLFLPLYTQQSSVLGVFVASNVRLAAPRATPVFLAHTARLCTEKLLLHKQAVTDPLTGLYRQHCFTELTAQEITRIQEALQADTAVPSSEAMPDQPMQTVAAVSRTDGSEEKQEFHGCFGLIRTTLPDLKTYRKKQGHQLADAFFRQAAGIFQQACPAHALCACMSTNELTALVPAASLKVCRKTAEQVAQALAGLTAEQSAGTQIHLSARTGWALYPQDMHGQSLQNTSQEQALDILELTRYATDQAAPDTSCGFSRILQNGGRIASVETGRQVHITPGHLAGVETGQHFQVYPANSQQTEQPKAEIRITSVAEETASAHCVQITDPCVSVQAGDSLRLVSSRQADFLSAPLHQDLKQATGLSSLTEFSEQVEKQLRECTVFTFALLYVPEMDMYQTEGPEKLQDSHKRMLVDLPAAVEEFFGRGFVAGVYGSKSLVFFFPETAGKRAVTLMAKVQKRLAAKDILPVAGLSHYPFIDYSRTEIFDNCAKALAYARLLPAPHLGLMDSVALTIHADTLFSQGRIFDATEEYKRALLADSANVLARTSLGVCLARSGEPAKAKQQFRAAIKRDPHDIFARYNYGHICQRMKQTDEARKAYRQCLKIDKNHIYSLIRLGEIAQTAKRFAHAKQYLERAAQIPGGQEVTRRYQARLALATGKTDQAREFLHQALLHDPHDASSLHLMAALYLDNEEDPEVAEMFARQSVAISPVPRFVRLLARSLEVQGNTAQAQKILAAL